MDALKALLSSITCSVVNITQEQEEPFEIPDLVVFDSVGIDGARLEAVDRQQLIEVVLLQSSGHLHREENVQQFGVTVGLQMMKLAQ